MFLSQKKRFVTRSIRDKVPLQLQVLCWHLFDQEVAKQEREVDYLQIFEFEKDFFSKKLRVTHRQEEPPFSNQVTVAFTKELKSFSVKKLWVIDDETHQTMLLPEEY